MMYVEYSTTAKEKVVHPLIFLYYITASQHVQWRCEREFWRDKSASTHDFIFAL